MPKVKMTATAAGRLKAPAKGQIDYFDTGYPGLALRVTSKDARSWAYFGRLHGRVKRVTLGRYVPDAKNGEPGSISWARRQAGEMAEALRQGIDPTAEKREKRETLKRDSVEAVIEQWIRRDQAKNRSVREVQRVMDRDVIPQWKGRPIAAITRRDVIELLDRIADRGSETMARRAYAYLHRLFKWGVARDILPSTPMADLPKTGKETARDRVLNDSELAEVWKAAGEIGFPFGPAIRLLILTGARRDEIGSLRWGEIHADEIRLTGDRTKTGDAHAIPLAPEAKAILESLPRIVNPDSRKPEWCLTTTGRTPASGWSKAKTRLDAQVLEARRKALKEAGEDPEQAEPLAPWRLHDLRRTAATGLQRLGHRLEVIEAVLGHISGSRAGIVGVYQRYGWDQEKRAALQAWARHVAALAEGRAGAEIVSIERAREPA